MAPTFGRYRVTGTLGSGGMGDVFLAVDDVLGREVAIKTLKVKGALDGNTRFTNEARAVAMVQHPGIVQVFDVNPSADPPYLVMERVAGPSLKGVRLSASDARAMGIQIANALVAAHAQGIVHRDLKPANILAAGAGRWKLADFGVAHMPDTSVTMTGQFVGSPAYAPPEALSRGVTGAAGDVFGLGAVLYEVLTGGWPRSSAATNAAFLAPVPPIALDDRDLAGAIDRALAQEPEARPTAAELAALLAARPSAQQIAAPSPRGSALPIGKIALAIVAVTVLATVAGIATCKHQSEEPHVVLPVDVDANLGLGPIGTDPPPPPKHGKHGHPPKPPKPPKKGPDGQPLPEDEPD